MSGVWDTITGKSAKKAARASERAAGIAAEGQQEALEYLKQKEALPIQFREAGLRRLAGVYGLPGGAGTQEQLIEQAMASPLYQQQISGIEASVPQAEEAILRTAAATGGLRSGASVEDMAALAQERQALKNQALTQAYQQQLSGITGFAQMPTNVGQIAQMTAAPAMTEAQGITAGAQARQAANQAMTSNLFMLGGAALMSDIRLKDNIKHKGKKKGFDWFEWEWCPEAKELGLEGKGEGVMAHLVNKTNPEAVSIKYGLLCVDYKKLGLLEDAA